MTRQRLTRSIGSAGTSIWPSAVPGTRSMTTSAPRRSALGGRASPTRSLTALNGVQAQPPPTRRPRGGTSRPEGSYLTMSPGASSSGRGVGPQTGRCTWRRGQSAVGGQQRLRAGGQQRILSRDSALCRGSPRRRPTRESPPKWAGRTGCAARPQGHLAVFAAVPVGVPVGMAPALRAAFSATSLSTSLPTSPTGVSTGAYRPCPPSRARYGCISPPWSMPTTPPAGLPRLPAVRGHRRGPRSSTSPPRCGAGR
jgi:hypothetical protein